MKLCLPTCRIQPAIYFYFLLDGTIPGPSPLGEVVDYTPGWVEICIIPGILALGIFVVSVLSKPAMIIEQLKLNFQSGVWMPYLAQGDVDGHNDIDIIMGVFSGHV